MSTVQPPPPPAAGPANGPGNATAVAIKIPPLLLNQLQSIPLGQTLQGTISQANANLLQVQTPLGPLSLQTPMMLPKDAVLTLVLTNLSPPTFQIGQIDGKPVPGALTPNQAKAAGLPHPQLDAKAGGVLPPLQAGGKGTVTLLRPAAAAPTTPTSTAPGTHPAVQAAQASPQGAGQAATTGRSGAAAQASPTPSHTAPANTSTSPAAPAAQATTQTAAQPATTSAVTSTTLPSGTRFNITVVQVTQPSAALSSPAAGAAASGANLSQGAMIAGRVTGHTPQGQPIVQTPTATFALEAQGALKEGAQVTLRLDTQSLPSTAAQKPLSGASIAQALVNQASWDGFEEALTTLAGADPARFQQVAQTALPQPGAKLTNQLLFFISALKGGDLKGLFGDSATRVIDKERPGLLNRMMGDFQVMSRLADEPQSNDWRLALIPMWNSEQLEQLRLYYRGGGQDDEENDLEGARFILDFELSNIGRMQIDGLVKAQKKTMDLIVRTGDALPAPMRADIAEMTIAADALLGIQASVTFQAGAARFSEFPPLVDDPAMLGRPSAGVFA
ncbi:hypothetical protein ACFL12_04650 [Pseudomonadota bacterium]